MFNLTSFCFAGTKIRINLVFSVSPRAEAIRRTGARPPVGGWGRPPFGGLHLNNTE